MCMDNSRYCGIKNTQDRHDPYSMETHSLAGQIDNKVNKDDTAEKEN